jgi:thiol-disulfide isomerase/thioredoxin
LKVGVTFRVFGRHLMAVLAVGFLAAAPLSSAEAQRFIPWQGAETPPLALKDLRGGVVSLSDFRGKVVIINFWATWCEPCLNEMPSLQRLRERINGRFSSRPLEVLAVNLAESPFKVAEFTKKAGVTFPVLLDPDETAKSAWKVSFVPATFIISAEGTVRYVYFGEADWASDEVVECVAFIVANPKTSSRNNPCNKKS